MSPANAVASSSKRPAPSQSTPSPNKAAKRPRASTSSAPNDDAEDHDEEGDAEHEGGEEDGDLQAKIARKEARTIRNRESAQRSRNQRKAHLVYLEKRVVELEAENKALKGGETMSISGSPTSPSSYSAREASPAQSVISLANDLGIPSVLVNGTGVRLSNVAPPPADLEMEDVKPNIQQSPVPTSHQPLPQTGFATNSTQLDQLKAENSALRERISLLENLVKQVVAVANFSGLSTAQQEAKPAVHRQQTSEIVSPITGNSMDWSSLLSASGPVAPTAGLESTLSPPYYPSTITDAPPATSHQAIQQPESSYHRIALESNASMPANPVARHPAEVATSSLPAPRGAEKGKALQRARGTNSTVSTLTLSTTSDLITEERIALVARLVIALAHQRGWITSTTTSSTSPLGTTATTPMVACGMEHSKMESTN
ncbi:uncharacterized protein I303_101963 [Kwoniella dejecticola CBS 10117]|uniref:BZIP domain-containing protein n=1 Tax=Kwoniella dejecticola CBS 10117 TaxID=1296121 RepID=A0AAJ8MFJ3_9TREE